MDPRLHALALGCRGFLDDREGLRLHDLAAQHSRLGPVVEIGSYCGKSSIYLGSGVARAGGVLICVDHHRGNEENQPGWAYHDAELWDRQAGALETLPHLRRVLREAGLEDAVVVMVTRSTKAAALIAQPCGMVFIDGGHTRAAADADYLAWAPKVCRGGILAIHDLFPNPDEGGQAPIEIYRRALASGEFEELATVETLGVLRRK